MTLLLESRSLVVVPIALVLALGIGVTPVYAQRWLSEMPEPERVIQDIHGSDEIDTAAQQYSALFFLSRTIEFVFLGGEIPAAAQAKLQGYRRAGASVYQRMNFDPNCKAQDCPIRRYMRAVSSYDRNPQFEEGIRARYLSQQWRKEYAEALRRPTQQARPQTLSPQRPVVKGRPFQERAGMAGTSFVAGLICVFGIFSWMTARRRLRALNVYEFDHTTAGGVVTFDSYDDSLRHQRRKGLWALVWTVSIFAVPISALIAFVLGVTALTGN